MGDNFLMLGKATVDFFFFFWKLLHEFHHLTSLTVTRKFLYHFTGV